MANPNAAPHYPTTDGAFVLWRNAIANTVVFGGVIPPKAPNAPTNLSPSDSAWVTTLTPLLSWTYSNLDPANVQGAYQVQIKDSGGTVVHDTGIISSASASYGVPGGLLTNGSTYTWAVSTWDSQANLQGPWSSWVGFGADLTSPSVSAAVNGGAQYTTSTNVTLDIDATDAASGPSQMNFLYEGNTSVWQAYATSAPFTLTASDGLHTITINVKDAAGNIGSSDAIISLDTTLPTISITSPANGTNVGGQVTIQSSAADNVGLQDVKFYQSGTLIDTATTSPWEVIWDTTLISNASYSLTAVATDLAGNTQTSAAITATVDNHAPSVSITAPVGAATVQGLNTMEASASDYVGISKVEYFVDGVFNGVSTVSPYSVVWNTANVANGARTLTAMAYNTYGNTTTSSPVAVTVNNGSVTGTLAVSTGSTSGPGGTLQLDVTSGSAITWYGVEYKVATDSTWTSQSGSGSLSGGSATVPWTVPTTPDTYQIRIGLVDGSNNAGYTSLLQVVLPASPVISAVTGNQADIHLTMPVPASGTTYLIERSSESSFGSGTTDMVATGVGTSVFQDGRNHVGNGSFEWGMDGAGLPETWSGFGSGSAYTLETGHPTHGTYALRMDKTTTATEAGVLKTLFTGRGLVGRTLTLTSRQRTDSIGTGMGAGAWLELRFIRRDGTTASASAALSPLVGTNAWQHRDLTTTVPPGTYTIQVALVMGSTTGTAWVDEVQVELGSTYSTFSAGSLARAGSFFYRVRAENSSLFSNFSSSVSATHYNLPDNLGHWTRDPR